MPVGLCNAPATFEQLMEQVLSGLPLSVDLVYIDDILVPGKTIDPLHEVLKGSQSFDWTPDAEATFQQLR